MKNDSELASTWSRWHLIRAYLAQRAPASRHSDPMRVAELPDDDAFVARVMVAMKMPAQSRRSWARYIGGGAIAASVAAAALILSVPQSTSTDAVVAGAGRPVGTTASPIRAAAPQASRIAAAPVGRTTLAPWLDRQPTFLAARPTADGSAALSGSYLQQAAYAPDEMPMLMRDPQQHLYGAPYMILLVPDQNAPAQTPQH
jgi:sigma-E factor negative regulatory protein RseA